MALDQELSLLLSQDAHLWDGCLRNQNQECNHYSQNSLSSTPSRNLPILPNYHQPGISVSFVLYKQAEGCPRARLAQKNQRLFRLTIKTSLPKRHEYLLQAYTHNCKCGCY